MTTLTRRLHRRRARRVADAFPAIDWRTAATIAVEAAVLHFDAGSEVCHEGDRPYCAWIVLHGHVDVVVDGRAVACLGRGSEYGAAYLLRDQREPATLTARTRCRVLALDRRCFAHLQAMSLAAIAAIARRSHHSRDDHPATISAARGVVRA